MAQRDLTMIHPPIEDLLSKVDSKFSLVSLAAKRGRQINSYFSQLGEGLGAIVPPQVASVSRKPLSIALEEIAADKIAFSAPTRAGSPTTSLLPPCWRRGLPWWCAPRCTPRCGSTLRFATTSPCSAAVVSTWWNR